MGQVVIDGMIDSFFGRRPVSDFDQLVRQWRTRGVDQIRGELEQAYAAANA
jgi:putative aldouronate transport system substrate-binding protein